MDKKTIGKVIGNIIFYGLLLIFISISAVMLKAKTNGNQPSFFGNKFFIVLTGSMSPTIKEGDLVIVKETKPEEIKSEDVITFGSTSSDNLTTHRVKEVVNDNENISFITQGDANNVEDPMPVEAEVLVGKVNTVIPKVGTMLLWIQKNIMKILIVALVIITLSFVFSKFKEKTNKEKDKETKEVLEQ